MTTPRSPLWRMADQMAGGNLPAILAELAADGRSLRNICTRLATDHHIHTTPRTVAAWLDILDIDRTRKGAA